MKEARIIVKETEGISRDNEPITFGFPFPRGVVRERDRLTLLDKNNEVISLQMSPLAFWPDQSYKWVLLDFQASVNTRSISEYKLSKDAPNHVSLEGIPVTKEESLLHIETGVTSFYLDTQMFLPFKRVVTEGIDVIDGSKAGFILMDENNRQYEPKIKNISVETHGNLRVTIKVDGVFQNKNKKILQFIARIHFFANHSFVRLDFTLRNPRAAKHPKGLWDLGDPGSIFFRDLTLKVPLKVESETSIEYFTEKGTPLSKFNSNTLVIYQDSSGGENWKSSNHVNRYGKVTHSFRGYEVRDNEGVIKKGLRATPLIYIEDGNKGLSGTIQKFWQNFPKALEVEDNALKIRLFPKYISDLYELQGGEQKTHTIYLDFSRNPGALEWVDDPLIPLMPPEWYSKCRTFPYLSVNSEYKDNNYEALVETAVKGDNTFSHRREIIDEYGWRNFGEVYADHEAVKHSGPSPLISHYNNQYDLIYGAIRQYISKSDLSWYELMNNLAHHFIDIDIYHTDEDREEFNGGMFWHTNHYLDVGTCTHRSFSKSHLKYVDSRFCGGGPANEHLYTTGLLFHYYMTGNEASREAVLELVDWTIRDIEGPKTILGTIYDFAKKISTWKKVFRGEKVRFNRYPFTRGSGNLISALVDVYCLSSDEYYLRKAEEIILGCVHPKDDINSRDLLNAESNWSYTVCLQTIGKYLDLKVEIKELDEMYCYARDSLLHYAEWMLENEYPYLDKPEILEYPNETWSVTDIRKSNVFYYAYKHSAGNERKHFIERALFFYNYVIRKVNEFETKTLTRPIVVLLQNYGMYNYFIENPDKISHFVSCNYDVEPPREYVSIRSMLIQQIKDVKKVLNKTSIKKEMDWIGKRIR